MSCGFAPIRTTPRGGPVTLHSIPLPPFLTIPLVILAAFTGVCAACCGFGA